MSLVAIAFFIPNLYNIVLNFFKKGVRWVFYLALIIFCLQQSGVYLFH